MKVDEFRRVIQERIRCHNEWTYGIEKCWKEEIEILTEDIAGTIEFLRNECTADEYSWISEVIEDVVELVPNKELVRVYKNLMSKYPEESARYNIHDSIEQLETILEWEEQNGEKD